MANDFNRSLLDILGSSAQRVAPTTPKNSDTFAHWLAGAAAQWAAGPNESFAKPLFSTGVSKPNPYADFIKALLTKPKVFVSYHHAADRSYYQEFSRIFAQSYDVCHDNSVDREIDSDDSEYVIRRIREDYLTGTSCTIVLCGAQTRWRKFVDWEIKATLDKRHALIGINLPTNPYDSSGRVHKPDRLQDNIDSGYALWREWNDLVQGGAATLRSWVAAARQAVSPLNSRSLRQRNG